METWRIRPTPRRVGCVELCALDMTSGRYFESVAMFTGGLDVARFREAVARSLNLYPFLAGTLIQRDKRFFIDLDGPGVQLAYEERPEPCPQWGPAVAQINVPHLFLPTPARDPTAADRRVQGKPLLLAKLTRFADGHYVLGTSICHMVCDGSAATRWFADLNRIYCGEEITKIPEFSRAPILPLGDPAATTPSPGSGFTMRTFAPNEFHDQFFKPVYTCVPLSDEERGMLISMAVRNPDLAISQHDVLHALLLKSFAHASPRTLTHVALDMPYDARRVKGLGFPANYVGNATMHQLLTLPRAEAGDLHVVALAARLAENARPTVALARHDIGFRQREYESGRVDDFGALTNVKLALGKGTLMVSDLGQPSMLMQVPFEGTLLWTDLAINDPIAVRSAWVYGTTFRKESHRMLLVLPEEQVAPFLTAWNAAIAELRAHFAVRPAKAALH